MCLKEIVDTLLREKGRSLSWLASQVGKTFDGLRLGLIKESVKYSDIKKIAEVLDVSAGVFFDPTDKLSALDEPLASNHTLQEDTYIYKTTKKELEAYKELTERLKDQIKDKEKIIELLSNQSKNLS